MHTGTAKIPDAAQSNWISLAQIDIPNSTPKWTRFSAPFNYFNSTTLQYILFVVSAAGTSAHFGSIAYFDDLELIYNEPELDLTAFVQGPYTGSNTMTAALNPEFLPLSQPFNTAPWNLNEIVTVPSIPNAQVVDWILVDMRDAASAAAATAGTSVRKKDAFLLSDGSVVGMNGSTKLTTPFTISQNLYVVIWHRNHLGIMSNNALINADDKNNFWSVFVGKRGYLTGDYTLSGEITNQDKNDIWLNNQNNESQVTD